MNPYSVTRIGRDDARFETALGMLHDEFAAHGELERPEVLRRWLEMGTRRRGGCELVYELYVASSSDGSIVGVRDCHLIVEGDHALLYLAHVVVAPQHRRRGIGRLLRELPIDAARARAVKLLVAAEMEHPDPGDDESIIRLVAYGRAGFSAVSPDAMPYWQPDFRDPARIERPEPVPLLLVVNVPATSGLPKTAAHRALRHLDLVFADHCDEAHLAAARQATLTALQKWPGEHVPLLPLPATRDDDAALPPLARRT